MPDALELYREGRLSDAIEALNADVRASPMDRERRTFLFELLCFQGDLDRAGKQLSVLAKADPEAGMGIISYQRLLECERQRREMYRSGSFSASDPPARPVRGRLNGESFEILESGDPRLGARLEVFLAGQYSLIPFEHLSKLTIDPPETLRNLFWAPATLQGGDNLQGADLGDVVLPALTPFAWEHPDEEVQLGRVTEWEELEDGGEAPVGHMMLIVDGEDVPILEVRELEIDGPASAA